MKTEGMNIINPDNVDCIMGLSTSYPMKPYAFELSRRINGVKP